MIMLLLFPLILCVTLVLLVASAIRGRRLRSVSSVLVAVLMGLVLSYGLALLFVTLSPWFEDNGVPEFIEWRYRWAWAAELAGWLAIVIVPITLGLCLLLRPPEKRTSQRQE